LWLRLAEVQWPRLYAAAACGSLGAGLTVATAGWGIWQEWWIATLIIAIFAAIVMARAAAPSVAAIPPLRRGSRDADR
jgi:hypothetical protein